MVRYVAALLAGWCLGGGTTGASAWAQTAPAPIGSPLTLIGRPVGQPVGQVRYPTLQFDAKPSPFGQPGNNIGTPVDPSRSVAPVLQPATAAQDSFWSRFLRRVADLVPYPFPPKENPVKWYPSMTRSRRKKDPFWLNPD